ncbi:ABC transporter family substrate-binding protein [Streptomyces sp. NPDC052051]|uniref:ABC transporter family substrate-binding protein n=1 Tax=Streptomyces sp. NPDC052051 TaxID=3154649 RepID=UPI00343F38E1
MSHDGAGPGAVLRSATFLIAGALAATALAACSVDEERESKPTAAQDIAPAARALVTDGGTLRWAVDTVPETLNTYQADADATTSRVAAAVLPGMFRLDANGRPQRNSDVLESAKVTATEPKQVVVYRLDRRAVWSDGRRIDASDFAAQWHALSGRDSAYWTARNAGYDRIEKVERGANDREVKVTFGKPYADWESLFSPLYPKDVTGTPSGFNDGARKTLKVTAGPFAVQKVDRQGGQVTLQRNPRWWGRPAKLSEIALVAVPRDQRAKALADGRIDLAEVDPEEARRIAPVTPGKSGSTPQHGTPQRGTAQQGPPAQAAPHDVVIRKSLEPAYTQLALNGSKGPLSDERVRRAVARALDRTALAGLILKPLGLPVTPLGSHLALAGQSAYEDGSGALGKQDTAQAKELLTEAGWVSGPGAGQQKQAGSEGRKAGAGGAAAGALAKNGKPLQLRFLLPSGSGSQSLRTVGDHVARMLDRVGIRTEITKVPDDSFFRDHIASGDYDLALYSWPVSAFPATDARPIFAKPVPAADGSLNVEQNYTRVGTDQVDQLFDEAIATLDEDEERDLVRKADVRLWAVAGSIPLYQRPQLTAARVSVANAGSFGFQTPVYEDMGFLKKGARGPGAASGAPVSPSTGGPHS